MTERIQRLETIAMQLRRDIVSSIYTSKDGHPAPSLSIADIMAALYFDILRLKPDEPVWADRDYFILSKGHACPVLYASLARRGYFSPAELKTLRMLGSRLQGHPVMHKAPGVDTTSGSLGHGLPQACGIALAARRRKTDSMTFVITGDGELQEGIVWEAAMSIAKFKLSNIVAIVDNNGMQSGGNVDVVGGLYPLREKWEAFGWHVLEIDGHDMGQILSALDQAVLHGRSGNSTLQPTPKAGQPIVIIAKTIKGKGIPYMEGDNTWHKRVPTDAEYQQAMSIVGGLDLE